MSHGVVHHAVNTAGAGITLASIYGYAPAWSALACFVYYLILIWKEGVIQSAYAKLKALFSRKS